MEPGERIRLLRQLAEHLSEKEDWLHLDLILREFGFDTQDTWNNGDRYSYALEMLSRGRDADLLALHTHLFGFSGRPGRATAELDVWKDGQFRLFLSHVSQEKEFCSELKTELERYGICAFVAHEDIKPTREWIDEIEGALESCDALAAILHAGFGESKWTDQEVGYCHARRSLIIPVRMDLDPYGFIARFQAVNGRGKSADQIALDIYRILVRHPKTSARMADALVGHFEYSKSFAAAKRNVNFLRDVAAWTPDLLRRLERAEGENDQIEGAWGVPDQVRQILKENGSTYGEHTPVETDDFLPF